MAQVFRVKQGLRFVWMEEEEETKEVMTEGEQRGRRETFKMSSRTSEYRAGGALRSSAPLPGLVSGV